MPHIDLPEGVPGIRGLMMYRPDTALPINHLVEVLLQGPSPLSKGEREMIATRVSTRNECRYCSAWNRRTTLRLSFAFMPKLRPWS